jgi:integrase
MARRGHGEGSIYQRKDGRWVASITLEHRKRKYFYGDTRREVQEKLKVALHEQQQGMLATGPQQLLKPYLENWLEQVYKPTVKLNSYKQYKFIVNKHLIPSLGQLTIQKLTAAKVQAFYSQKLEEGLSPRSVILIHAVLHQALENAVKWGLVPRNVTKLVSLPHVERYDAQILTTDQAVKLLEVARGSRIEALLLLALTTGMRRGELLALRWDDVDFDRGVVYVRRTMSWISGYGYKESEPKTKAGRRKIVLANVALEALKEHRVHQSEVRSKAGDKWRENGIIFCSVYGGFFNPAKVLEIFKQLLKDAGLPHMRFHDLRHSAATILLVAGVHPKVVQERLGHSTIAMTMDVYSHVLPSMQQEAAEKIDDMFKGIS